MADTAFVTRTDCRVCASRNLELVLDYGQVPLAGGFFPADDARSKRTFPLHLHRCTDCTLLQVSETVNPELIFANYSYSSSFNRTLVEHNTALAGKLRGMTGDMADPLFVEIGCNDGILLNPLAKSGARVVGVDPSDVARRASEENGWPLVQSYFDRRSAEQVLAKFGSAEIIVANNVCAHMDDPNVLVAGVRALLAPSGRFVFEVHYQGDLVGTQQYDTVYHEHTCYYSLRSLQQLLAAHELEVIDVQRIPIHGGSIRVTAARIDAEAVRTSAVDELLAEEERLDLSAFRTFAERHRLVLHDLLADLARAGRKVVAYGASGRATILLNFCGIGPDLVDHVSDLSPLRYGRVVPGVGVPIRERSVFRDSYPDYALLTAWNYEAEIVADEQEFAARGGKFIVPLPTVRII